MFNNIVLPHCQSSKRVGRLETEPKEGLTEREPYGQVGIPGNPAKLGHLAETFVLSTQDGLP
jgi:hypothetical protein